MVSKKYSCWKKGTPGTYSFMEKVYGNDQFFSYAEFGFYKADTARNICERFPNCTLHLFDYHENIEPAQEKLSKFNNKIYFYGNSQKYNDSYNWNLIKLIKDNQNLPLFDYYFLRPSYHVVEEVIKPERSFGTQAYFNISNKSLIDEGLAHDLLNKFQYVMD